jgi:hypothetical protein
MAGTRTAPAFTAAATRRIITLHLIDASGDLYPESFDVAIAATAAAIEAWAAAYAAGSQASTMPRQISATAHVRALTSCLRSRPPVSQRQSVLLPLSRQSCRGIKTSHWPHQQSWPLSSPRHSCCCPPMPLNRSNTPNAAKKATRSSSSRSLP